jgi:hypothetical protein
MILDVAQFPAAYESEIPCVPMCGLAEAGRLPSHTSLIFSIAGDPVNYNYF